MRRALESPYHPRALKKKLLILLAALAAALVAAEIVLGVFLGAYVTQIYRLDDDRLHELIPNARKYFVHHPINGGGAVSVVVGSDGFRGHVLPVESGEGQPRRLRVAVYGDSIVMGEYSLEPETLVGQLEQQLTRHTLEDGRTVHVVNAGVVAYGPDQTLLRMEATLPSLDPDLAVVAFFADNDFGDLMRNKLFRLGEDGTLVRCAPVISDKLRAKFDAGRNSTAIYRWGKKFWRGWKAGDAADAFTTATPEHRRQTAIAEVERWLEGCRWEYEEHVEKRDPEVRDLFEDHFDSDVCLEPESESAQYKKRLFAAVLGRMGAVCAARKIPLLVVVVPSPFEICTPIHGGHVDRAKHPAYDPTAMTGAIEAMATAHGLSCVNLYQPFVDAGADDLYFLAPDNHWNAAGQRLAAEIVTARIAEDGLLVERQR